MTTRKQLKTIEEMKANLLKADKKDGFNLDKLCFYKEPNTTNVIVKVEYSRILVNVVDGNTMFYRIFPNGKKTVMTHIEGTMAQMLKHVEAMPIIENCK